MAQNDTFFQDRLRALIDKEKEIQGILDQARQQADQKITSAHQKAADLKQSAREEAESQAKKMVAEASSLEKGTGKASGSIPLSETPSDEAFERAAQFLVDLVTGTEEG